MTSSCFTSDAHLHQAVVTTPLRLCTGLRNLHQQQSSFLDTTHDRSRHTQGVQTASTTDWMLFCILRATTLANMARIVMGTHGLRLPWSNGSEIASTLSRFKLSSQIFPKEQRAIRVGNRFEAVYTVSDKTVNDVI